jgi:hypothetical protein
MARCKGHYDIAAKHLRKYVDFEYPEMKAMREAIGKETAERLKELS